MAHITIRSQADPDTIIGEGDDSVAVASAKVWWVSPLAPGEEEYTFRDIGVELEVEAGKYYLSYTDDTDRNPRRIGRPANVTHRLERDLGDAPAGPFLVTVG